MRNILRFWRWWSRGLLVYRWANTTKDNQVFFFGQVQHPIMLQPQETMEVTIYPRD